jgi:hypothetical protein
MTASHQPQSFSTGWRNPRKRALRASIPICTDQPHQTRTIVCIEEAWVPSGEYGGYPRGRISAGQNFDGGGGARSQTNDHAKGSTNLAHNYHLRGHFGGHRQTKINICAIKQMDKQQLRFPLPSTLPFAPAR